MSYADDCTRVYAPRRRVAHLLPPGDSPNTGYPVSLCNRQMPLFGAWLGTGSQTEYETAAQLPLCRQCERKLGAA